MPPFPALTLPSCLSSLCFADAKRNVGRYRCLPARAASDAGSSVPRCRTASECSHGHVCAKATVETHGVYVTLSGWRQETRAAVVLMWFFPRSFVQFF